MNPSLKDNGQNQIENNQVKNDDILSSLNMEQKSENINQNKDLNNNGVGFIPVIDQNIININNSSSTEKINNTNESSLPEPYKGIIIEENKKEPDTVKDIQNKEEKDKGNNLSFIDSLNLPDTPEEAREEEKIKDINITSINDIIKILIKKKYDFVTFEPTDNEVIINFRKDKIIQETKYIKYPIYSGILLKAKSITKLNLEITNDEQESNIETEIDGSYFKITAKTIPSNFGEKLFFKAVQIDKKISNKTTKKITLSQVLSFIGITAIIGLIIGGSFLAFIVLNAQTVEDVRFFAGLGISLNEINNFIARVVTIIFSILLLIETIGLVIFLFKFFLTPKTLKKKKITNAILSVILLITTFSTASAWMYIDQKIKSLPNWQEMSYGEIQLYDNDKLVNENFTKKLALLTDTSNLIGPINIRFDLSYLAKNEEKRGITIKSFEWDFGGGDIEQTVLPILIKSFTTPKTVNVKVKILGIDIQGKNTEKIIEGIPYINISYTVGIEEKILNSGGKIVTFDASSLGELGTIRWYDINDLKNPIFSGPKYINGTPIFQDTIIVMKIQGKDSEITKLFIIKGDNEVEIEGKIKYSIGFNNDLEVIFSVENVSNSAGKGFIEKYIWHIGNQTYTKEGNINEPEKSSEVKHIFNTYGEQEVSVDLINSAGETKTLYTKINLTKVLKINEQIGIFADGEKINNVIYNQNLNEYFVANIGVPNEIKFDGRYIKADSALYTLNEISWDYNSDGDIDFVGKIGTYEINSEGNYTITAYIEFINRRKSEEKIKVIQKIFIEAVEKEAIVDFKIIADSEYAPVTISLDGSKSKVKDSNIIRFTWDYGDGIIEDRDAVVPGHKYVSPGDYEIKLTITTKDGRSFSSIKHLILKPTPQKVKIKTSVLRAPVGQGIDFTSSDSEGQIINYFWDFGDGNISTQANPTHSYSKIGKYKVQLKLEFTNRNVLQDSIEIDIY